MKPGTSSRVLHDASWILVGALLGSSICMVIAGGQSSFDTAGAASIASFAVSALMLSTLHHPAQELSAAPRPC